MAIRKELEVRGEDAAEAIRAICRIDGVTTSEMARRVGLHRATLYQSMRDPARLSFERGQAVAEALGWELRVVLRRSPSAPKAR